MANEKQTMKEVIYKFEKANDCRTIYFNGVWGGVNYPNEIRMELFYEMVADPDSVVHEVTPEGVGKEIKRIPKSDKNAIMIIREIQVVAIMSPATAKFLGQWLLDQAKQAEELSK